VNDHALLNAMGSGDAVAWGIYETRFKPVLEAYARHAKIPHGDWPVCVVEVLEDEGLRLSSGDTRPMNLAGYLITAAQRRFLRLKRAESCRAKNYDAASEDRAGEWVVSSLCSEDSLRTSRGPDGDAGLMASALRRLATELSEGLTTEEESILVWVSERVPHAQIAEWLGVSYDACTKRIWRLCRRLRSETGARRATYSRAEQDEIDRFLRRASAPQSA
jgi:DNA-directed RNA polymerase specialized sigma24 family protein